MLAIFCVRLALGLVIFLPLIWTCLPHPRFVRTQFLTALGLMVIATLSAWSDVESWVRGSLAGTTALTAIGVFVWTLESTRGDRAIIVVTALAAAATLGGMEWSDSAVRTGALWAGDIVSAALLGGTVTAMLAGHSYLISPGLSLTPLLRLIAALFAALAARLLVSAAAFGLWLSASAVSEAEIWLWLPVRWLVGIAGPLVFGGMAYSAAKIRSTQSATGILYVAVVFAILGELVGLILARQTGLPL